MDKDIAKCRAYNTVPLIKIELKNNNNNTNALVKRQKKWNEENSKNRLLQVL